MKIVVLMPAYRAGQRVVDTFNKIPSAYRENVIIVDDRSPDNTYALAKKLSAKVYRNPRNLGYGGNLKVCLQKGLASQGDVFVELHADGQYDPKYIERALQTLKVTDGMLVGSRLAEQGGALKYGMPPIKYAMNLFLTWVANVVLGTKLTEFQSGFRVYTRKFLEQSNFRAASNDHLFSLETILLALNDNFTVSEFPVTCTYEPGVTQMGFKKGIKYTLEMLWSLVRFRLAKAGRRDSVFQAHSS